MKKTLLQPFRAYQADTFTYLARFTFNLDPQVHVFEKKFEKKTFLSFLLKGTSKQAFKNIILNKNSSKIRFFSKN